MSCSSATAGSGQDSVLLQRPDLQKVVNTICHEGAHFLHYMCNRPSGTGCDQRALSAWNTSLERIDRVIKECLSSYSFNLCSQMVRFSRLALCSGPEIPPEFVTRTLVQMRKSLLSDRIDDTADNDDFWRMIVRVKGVLLYKRFLSGVKENPHLRSIYESYFFRIMSCCQSVPQNRQENASLLETLQRESLNFVALLEAMQNQSSYDWRAIGERFARPSVCVTGMIDGEIEALSKKVVAGRSVRDATYESACNSIQKRSSYACMLVESATAEIIQGLFSATNAARIWGEKREEITRKVVRFLLEAFGKPFLEKTEILLESGSPRVAMRCQIIFDKIWLAFKTTQPNAKHCRIFSVTMESGKVTETKDELFQEGTVI